MENRSLINTERIPEELKIILEMVKLDHLEPIYPLLPKINWKLFLEFAIHHRLFPLLYPKLKKMDQGQIPGDTLQILGQIFKSNTFYMLQLCGEMETICKVLNDSQIPVLALKGPVLGADLYGDVSLRTSGDLDMLIPIADLEKADEALLRLGYQKDDYIKTVLNDWKWRHHHITYFHPQKKMKVEIHWRLNPGPGKEPSFEELWERKRRSSATNYPVYYLEREDLFLFLVSHGARHGWSRLRWLTDIHQLLKQKMDWALLIRLLKKHQLLHVGGQAVVLSSHLLGTPIPERMNPFIEKTTVLRLAQAAVFYCEEMIDLHNDSLPPLLSDYHKRYLFLLMSKRQRFFFIISFLYPYPADAEALPLPKPLHFLYFPLRPFLWAWRRRRNHALS